MVVGKQELTNAEQARERFLLDLLIGRRELRSRETGSLIRLLWFPLKGEDRLQKLPNLPDCFGGKLNAAQEKTLLSKFRLRLGLCSMALSRVSR